MGVITDEEEEEEEEKKKMKTMLVGVTLDTRSRELLTWSLVKLALPGDHVIALHVLPSSFGITISTTINSRFWFQLILKLQSFYEIPSKFASF